MSQLNSYIPETVFMDRKDLEHTRLCLEDCALVNPTDHYRVVAARGKEITVGNPFAPLFRLSVGENNFLLHALRDQKRIVLMGDAGAILIFSEWVLVTGLLFAVCPKCESRSVCRVLRLLGKEDFAFSPACLSVSDEPHRSDAEAYRQLSELLYYTDRIFASVNSVPLWTRTRLIANFAGCRAECDSLCITLPPLLKFDEIRLSAFLMCLFLSSRAIGTVQTRAKEQDRMLVYQAELCEPHEKTDAGDLFPFMRLSAFENIGFHKTASGWILEINLHRIEEKMGLFATQTMPIGLRISFRFVV